METIKIGRREFKIQTGDYVLFNGSVYQFCSGDGRILYHHKFDRYRHATIPASVLKKIPLSTMQSKKIPAEKNYPELTYWYF